MSSAVAPAPLRAARPRLAAAGAAGASWTARRALAIAAFAVLAMMAALRFASLLEHPSLPRSAAIVALAALLGGVLDGLGRLSVSARAAGAQALIACITAGFAALWSAGVPARQLLPWHWGLLLDELGRGVEALDGLWPYRGHSPQARAAVMACVAATVIPAAALTFWPARGGATRRRLGALALLVALYVTGAANGPRAGWQYQGLVALFALCLWGWSARSRRAEDGRAAAWLLAGTLASVVAASALAGGPVIDVASWTLFGERGADTAFDWNQTYRPLPWSTSSAEMIEVSSASPHLWRATELDRFDGTGFLASGEPPIETPGIAGGPVQKRWITSTTVVVRGLRSNLLLSPGEIRSATAAGRELPSLQAPAADGTQRFSGTLATGTRYTTSAYVPRPTAAEMRRAPTPAPGSLGAYVEFEVPGAGGRLLRISGSDAGEAGALSGSPYLGVYALARRLAAGAGNGYEIAARIQAFLRRNYTYNLRPPADRYPIVGFLMDNRTGYCQQFSAAMALMLRMDGIPARVGAGFLAGTRNPATARFAVTGHDAHAWVEVFYQGIGWVSWDPTPEGHGVTAEGALGGATRSPGALAAEAGKAPRHANGPPARGAPQSASPRSAGSVSSTVPVAIGLAAALLAAGIVLQRRRRRQRRADGDGTLAELTRALRVLGLEPPTGTTLAELERRLARSHGEGAAGYLRALRELRYAPAGASAPSARERRMLRRALSGGRGPVARLRGIVALPPGGGA